MTNSEIQNLKNLLNSGKTFNLGAEILKQLSQEDYEVFYNNADAVVYSGLFTTKEEYEDFYQYVHKHNNCSFVFVGPGIYYKNLFELPEYNRISVIRKINDYRNRN